MPGISAENVLSWSVQVFVMASLGALLPMLFRIRHPRSQLVYCYLLLGACAVLPLVQTWQHPLVLESAAAGPAQPAAVATVSQDEEPAQMPVQWNQIMLWILAAGIAARIGSLLVGFRQLRRYRAAAKPLFPLPESVKTARELTKQDALVCISADEMGPLTFGFTHPIILLPHSFLSLSEDAQSAIATHELLHVRRQDWLATLLEEALRTVLWFQPAVWWLLSQVRLAREQLVDIEVVRLTSARESYIRALLNMSGVSVETDLVSAFMQRRHLTQRMHSLLSEVSMSKIRLLCSYVSMAAVLAAFGAIVLASFPLIGQPQIQQAAPADGAGISVDAGGMILHRTPVFYPWDAAPKRIEGAVFVQLSVNDRGEVVDARVLSGPEELRKDVLQTVLQWHYLADGGQSRAVQARIDFQVPPAAAPAQAPAVVPRSQSLLETIDVSELPDPLRAEIWQRVRNFKGQPFSNGLMRQVENLVAGADSHLALRWSLTEDKNHTLKFVVAATPVEASLQTEPRPAVDPAQRSLPPGANLTSQARQASAPQQTDPQPTEGARTRQNMETVVTTKLALHESERPTVYRVGGGVTAPRIVRKVDPQYSPEAREARIQGVVVLEAIIQTDGTVQIVRVRRSLAADGVDYGLDQQAIDALSQWKFAPGMYDGRAVPVMLNVEVNFHLK